MGGKNTSSSSTTPMADESGLSGRRVRQNSTVTNYGIAVAGEFLGTFLFFTAGYCAAQAAMNANAASPAGPNLLLLLYISLVFAVSLTVNAWLFFRVSGGLFNPALTMAFVLLRLMPPVKGALLAVTQLVAGIFAAGVAKALVPNHTLTVQTTLGNGVTPVMGFFLEAGLTAELTLAVLMIAVEKHRATFMAPLVIGAALGIGHLVGISLTGASMNPSRSFGPAVVAGHFNSDHWIYWVGPIAGAAAAAGIYKLLLVANYQNANPGQDADGLYTDSDDGHGESAGRGHMFVDPPPVSADAGQA